ncbi:MAG: type II secretion system F family protein [Candidatus Rokubacteria bacterium]|nr:type II secretion system F family protein [Candidatus Rokubacteria bacterium]
MATFLYRAFDRSGNVVAGVMEAADARAVVERLQRDAYFPVHVAPEHAADRLSAFARLRLGPQSVGRHDLVAFTQQLASLLEAGLPVDRALGILQAAAPTPRLATITGDLLRSIQGGSALSEALAKHHPRPFSRLYVSMVRAGEKGGVLETTLGRLARVLEDAQEFRDTVTSALVYPALLMAVGAVTVVFLMTFVVPRFADIFRDLGQPVPLPTEMLLATSAALQRHWWGLLLGCGAALLGAWTGLSTETGRWWWDRLALRLPLAGSIVLKAEVARFALILGTLLRGGVPILTALGAAEDTTSNIVLRRAVARLGDQVRRGTALSAAMTGVGMFPPLALHLVRVGEETGRLEDMLLKLGETLEVEVRRTVKRLTSLLEPGIILAVGLVVGFIVVAMLMAIFSITEIPL